ncbi:MAG: hypothetical protein U5Q03_15015 [Bacteroidota bacterium]|nr:hypothetical protein [Bacteroidota bacterium]
MQKNTHSHGGPVTVFHMNTLSADKLREMGGKYPTPEFVYSLTRAQLRLFVDAIEAGDGRHPHLHDLWQRDPKAVEAYELAWILLGRLTHTRPTEDGHQTVAMRTTTTKPEKAAKARPEVKSTVLYSGTYRRPVTDNSTWLMRRNGKTTYTGNSLWGVDESTAKHHVDPDVLFILQALTEGYLWPYLEEAGVTDFKRFRLWRDYSDLTSRPMTVEQALAMHERGVINDEYVRMVGNVPDIYAGPGAPILTRGERRADPRANQEPPENVAAAAPKKLTNLARIDQRLGERVTEASEAAFHRAMERAGAKARAKARKDRQLSSAIDGVDNALVTRHLGPKRVEQLQLTDDQLIPADTFDPLRDRLERLLAEAQEETRSELSELFGEEVEPDQREAEDRRSAIDAFIAALIAVATARLFTDAPSPDPAEVGEFGDEIASGQMVAELLTRAGGDQIAEFTPETPRGLALGQRTRAALRDHGYVTESLTWEWAYIRTPQNPYEPHQNLNGVTVLSADDPRLGGYYPGDHRFCTCGLVPSVLPT